MNIVKYLGKDNENLQAMLELYDEELKKAPERLSLKGKLLSLANREHVAWLVHYDEKRVELKILTKHFQAQVDRVRGRLFQQYTDRPSREYSERAKDKLIDNDDEFLNANDLLLQVEEMYEKYAAIIEAFKSRGFLLRNLTEIQAQQLNDPI
jgi:FMN phosphatase YigB (HAD superfamily)